MKGVIQFFPGIGWRVSASIAAFVGWLVFLIIWFFFYASGFEVYQNIAIFLASLLVFGAIEGAIWGSFGMKFTLHGKRGLPFPGPKPPWEPPEETETPHEHLRKTDKKVYRHTIKKKKK